MGVFKALHDARESRRRRRSPLYFNDGVSQADFVGLVDAAARHTPRVARANVSGMMVHLLIESNSGLSRWSAVVDFNDYGHLTGSCWISSDNSDSQIPRYFADVLSAAIEQLTAHPQTTAPNQPYASYDPDQKDARSAHAVSASPPGWYPTDAGLRYWDGVTWTHHFAPSDHATYAGMSDAAEAPSRPRGATIVLTWIVALATCGYMLPWAIAASRGTSNRNAVGVMCLVTGWTVIGWLIALVMAIFGHKGNHGLHSPAP